MAKQKKVVFKDLKEGDKFSFVPAYFPGTKTAIYQDHETYVKISARKYRTANLKPHLKKQKDLAKIYKYNDPGPKGSERQIGSVNAEVIRKR